jgi:WD40 repeat protein
MKYFASICWLLMELDIPDLFDTRFENDICSGALSDVGRLLFGQNGGSVAWKRDNKLVVARDAHLQTHFVEWFPSGSVALSGGSEGQLKVWDCDNENEENEENEILVSAAAVLTGGHVGAVLCAALVGRGRVLASGGRDGLVVVWDVSNQKATSKAELREELWCARAVNDDLSVFGGNRGRAFVRQKKGGKKIYLFALRKN